MGHPNPPVSSHRSIPNMNTRVVTLRLRKHEHARPRLVHREPRKRGAFAWPCPCVRAARPHETEAVPLGKGRGAGTAGTIGLEGHPPNTEQETRNVPPLRCGASTSKHAPRPACLRWCVRSEHAAQPGSPRGKAGITHAWGICVTFGDGTSLSSCAVTKDHVKAHRAPEGQCGLEESAVDPLGPCTSGG